MPILVCSDGDVPIGKFLEDFPCDIGDLMIADGLLRAHPFRRDKQGGRKMVLFKQREGLLIEVEVPVVEGERNGSGICYFQFFFQVLNGFVQGEDL